MTINSAEPQPTTAILFKLTPLDLKPISGTSITTKRVGEYFISVNALEGSSVSSTQAVQIQENGFKALQLASKISEKCLKGITIRCAKNTNGYMSSSFKVDDRLLNDDADSQTAAVLHEIIENLEENEGITLGNNEAIPHIAEFLFTGNSRLEYFRWLNDSYYSGQNSDNPHVQSWNEVVVIIYPESGDQKQEVIFTKLLEARKLSKEQKVDLIKNAIIKATDRKK